MEEIERTVIELEQRGKSNTHRIDDLEEQSKLLNELVTSVKLLAQNMQVMAEEQKKQGRGWTRWRSSRQRVGTASKKPSSPRWCPSWWAASAGRCWR